MVALRACLEEEGVAFRLQALSTLACPAGTEINASFLRAAKGDLRIRFPMGVAFVYPGSFTLEVVC